MSKSTLIAETTREERIRIVTAALAWGDDCDECALDTCGIDKYYLPYVEGEVELRELNMREGAVIVVIGGIANEIALDEVSAAGGTLTLSEDAPGVSELTVPKGPTLHLLAAGDGVNYAAGPGNPIQIMDFSFAVQLCAVDHLLRNRGKLPNDVLRLTDESDRRIATLALEARGVRMALKKVACWMMDVTHG